MTFHKGGLSGEKLTLVPLNAELVASRTSRKRERDHWRAGQAMINLTHEDQAELLFSAVAGAVFGRRYWLLGWKPGIYLGTHLRSHCQRDGLLSSRCSSLAPMPSPRRFPPRGLIFTVTSVTALFNNNR